MPKKILLINPCPSESSGINEATVHPPLGLAYLASYLRESADGDSYNVRIIDANILGITNDRLIREIKATSPDIVGIHMNIILGKPGAELAKLVKRETSALVCVGGPVVSSNPQQILDLSQADIAVLGEGEITFGEICSGQSLDSIKGIAYRKNGTVCFNEPRPLIQDLDTLPYPAYDLLPPLSTYRSRARKPPMGVIITSRGCPFRCTFCNTSIFGKRFRPRSPENVLGEIDLLVNKFGINQLDVLDDNFTLDMDRAERILDLIIERPYKLYINLQNGVRADRLNRTLVRKMKQAGVFKAGIGVESANEEVRKSIRKSLKLENVEQALRWFREEGIITIAFFIIGFPNDTEKTINETIDFAIRANPSIANFSLLIPFPGTQLYTTLVEAGQMAAAETPFYESGFYDAKMYHRCASLTPEQVAQLQKRAYTKFNFRPLKILETIRDIRSLTELKWTIQAGIPILKNIIFRTS